ncbi:MAG TPA: ABC transporter ATP-binding protein [Anaerolineae bacterium]|nr:ABC transporter ATP-binding protein [Anaerolineae bacterium]HQK14865.1 ABC transporter ATP-binding protein [Anaerolineae bacterium]
MTSTEHLLEVKHLSTRFYTEDGVVYAVNDISYTLDEGDTLGVVGESGCGKSVHALSIMRLIPTPPGKIVGGEIYFRGRDLLKLSDEGMRKVRGAEIAMIFQDPMTSLNPVKTVGFQIMEALMLHEGMDKARARARTIELLNLVGIPEAAQRVDDYPHQFSGGMRQRAMIAMGLSCNPSLLIADEPTTALDVTIQAQIVDLVKRLQEKLGMAVIWITHDLGVVARLARRVNVMYAGRIIESGPVKEIYGNPHHPYTVGLLGSLPSHGTRAAARLFSIPGEPPDLIGLLPGCAFAPRCHYQVPRCLQETPPLEEISPGHVVACWEKDKVRRV